MVKWGDGEVRELLLPAEDQVNQSFSGTVKVAQSIHHTDVDTVVIVFIRRSLLTRPSVSNHTVARQYVCSACSVCEVEVKAEAADWEGGGF